MLDRANELREQPEFYNTLINTCTTNIVRHLEHLADEDLPLDLRILFPGYADRLAFEIGLIDLDGNLEQARERFQINARSSFIDDGRAWSRQIRQVE